MLPTVLVEPHPDRSTTATTELLFALLPGMKPRAPRRNLLVVMLYVLLTGTLCWIIHLLVHALGFTFDVIMRPA